VEQPVYLRVLIADDHPLVRQAIRATLQNAPDLVVVGEVSSGPELIPAVERLEPDILILDLSMPDHNPAAATRELRRLRPQLRILVLTAYSDEAYVFGLLEAGVRGYVLKEEESEAVMAGVRAVAKGETWFSQKVMAQVVAKSYPATESEMEQPLLSERELEVLRLVGKGYSNRNIAQQLVITEDTVKKHLSRIMQKLHVSTRLQAVVVAAQRGLMDI